MQHGDFTRLAKAYAHRAGYSPIVLEVLAKHVGVLKEETAVIADVGAGTGKLTEQLCELGLKNVVAIEPNDAMREEGIRYTERFPIDWRRGSGEETGLENASVDWLLMASSFHWVDHTRALAEFHRVIKPGGYFTALWNPRDLGSSELQARIEARVKKILPELERISSGSAAYTAGLDERLLSTRHFEGCIFVEARHEVAMSKDRYLGAWRSVNDVQVQAGPDRFEEIIHAVKEEIATIDELIVPYKTRAWTVRRVVRPGRHRGPRQIEASSIACPRGGPSGQSDRC